MAAKTYTSIQAARAFAALIVVMLHVGWVTNDISAPPLGMPTWLSFGFAGVDLFFVISGFIISHVASRPITVKAFAMRRAIRILPFYWLFTIVWVLALVVAKRPIPDVHDIWASLAVLPLSRSPVLGVGWSLEHEFIFYGLVAVLIACGRIKALGWILACLFVIGLAVHVVVPEYTGREVWDFHLASLYHFDFLLGVMIYRLQDRIAQIPPVLLLTAATVAFPLASLATLSFYPDGHVSTQGIGFPGLVRVVSFGAASAFLISGLISLEARRPAAWGSRAVAVVGLVGDSSFSLYLMHPILFAVLGAPLAKIGAPPWPSAVIAVSIAVMAAVAFYRAVELPYLQRFARGPSPRRAA